MSLARNPAFWTGLALIAVGGGNWINGRVKLAEYEAVISHSADEPSATSPEEFPYLNERTTATLLEPLRSRLSTHSVAEGRRDFYTVVLTGGRFLVVVGAFLMAAGTYWENRRRPGAS